MPAHSLSGPTIDACGDVGDLCVARLDASRAPDLLAVSAGNPGRYPFLLESSAGAAAQSRYDILLAFPGDFIELGADQPAAFDFFDSLDAAFAREQGPRNDALPFVGGWFVYLGYEMAAQVEPSLDLPAPGHGLPLALAVRCPAAIVRDHKNAELYVLAEDNDRARVAAMLDDLSQVSPAPVDARPVAARLQEAPPRDYLGHVETARELILAGDIFQANLSRSWHGHLLQDADPARLYAALRAANPAPFSGLMRWRDSAVISSSPERLLSLSGDLACTRPIAGTRPRAADADDSDTREMLAHPKERAEHVMLIDLERNDLGRVCRPGTVAADELMVAETYAHVHHIVSSVCGRLRPGVGPGAALRAVFPGGTITGCPKVRCMEIIAQLEGEARGAYTGSFGYLSRCGGMDSNILIRSITQAGRQVSLRAGAGIVADSDPDRELEETRAKARGVLKSFDISSNVE